MTPKHPLSRRDFLRTAATLGGLMAAASFLEACARAGLETPTVAPTATSPPMPTTTSSPASSPTPISSPSPTASPGPTATSSPSPSPSPSPTAPPSLVTPEEVSMTQVAFVKTRDRAEGVRRALDLLGLNPVSGERVLLKPNFNSADPTPGSTHNDVLRALVEALWEMDARAITVADRSGMAITREVMQQKGIFDMAREMGFETLVFDELEEKEWVMVQPPESHWKKGFPFARPCLEAGALVQTCCLKTHRFGGHFTMSLKNSVGMVANHVPGDNHDYMGELHSSPYQRLMIAEINAAYTPALIVLDGVEAFVTGGPESGKRVWAEVVLAGMDRVAIDAVGVAVLRHFGTTRQVSRGSIFQQEQIARAVELGLGADGPEKIQFVTGDPESEAYAAQIREVLAHG